jgi:hypothetical protein
MRETQQLWRTTFEYLKVHFSFQVLNSSKLENAVGSSLLNQLRGLPYELVYWLHGNDEVDYILHTPPENLGN